MSILYLDGLSIKIFQEILEEVSCEDDESAQEGEDCDETAEE